MLQLEFKVMPWLKLRRVWPMRFCIQSRSLSLFFFFIRRIKRRSQRKEGENKEKYLDRRFGNKTKQVAVLLGLPTQIMLHHIINIAAAQTVDNRNFNFGDMESMANPRLSTPSMIFGLLASNLCQIFIKIILTNTNVDTISNQS